MKIRLGFVSNSSSTSFYIDASRHTRKEVEKSINEYQSSGYNIKKTTGSKAAEDIVSFESVFSSVGKEELILRYKRRLPHNCIVVESAGDNMIDGKTQDMLVTEYKAFRQHWG